MRKTFFDGLSDVLEVWTRILCDTMPTHGNIIYVFGQTQDNQQAVLAQAAAVWRENQQAVVIIDDGTTDHGYPGYDLWSAILLKHGVLPASIRPLRIEGDLNTLTESRALIAYAGQAGSPDIVIVCPPFHQIRACITAVSVAVRSPYQINLYNSPSEPGSWHEIVQHSQGILKNSRAGLLKDEMDRMEKYYQKGDLVSLSEVKRYLDARG